MSISFTKIAIVFFVVATIIMDTITSNPITVPKAPSITPCVFVNIIEAIQANILSLAKNIQMDVAKKLLRADFPSKIIFFCMATGGMVFGATSLFQHKKLQI